MKEKHRISYWYVATSNLKLNQITQHKKKTENRYITLSMSPLWLIVTIPLDDELSSYCICWPLLAYIASNKLGLKSKRPSASFLSYQQQGGQVWTPLPLSQGFFSVFEYALVLNDKKGWFEQTQTECIDINIKTSEGTLTSWLFLQAVTGQQLCVRNLSLASSYFLRRKAENFTILPQSWFKIKQST